MACISAARCTEGVLPATALKKKSRQMPTTADSRLRRPSSVVISPARKETWRPETAITWASPDRRRALYTPSGSSVLSPVSSAVTRGAVLSGKARATLSFSAPLNRAGQQPTGARSGRSAVHSSPPLPMRSTPLA